MDRETLESLARLVRLHLTPDQEERAGARIGRLLQAFASLQGLPTDDVEPSPYPLPLPHRLREDVPGPVLSQDEVLANAPSRRAGAFLVPRIVE